MQRQKVLPTLRRTPPAGARCTSRTFWMCGTRPGWAKDSRFGAIYCANMLHISPWQTTTALMQGSAAHLAPGGVLITYGPYLEDAVATAEGNLSFDASLRAQNPAWGIRRLEDVMQVAAQAGLQLAQRHALPANNLLLVWQRAAHSTQRLIL